MVQDVEELAPKLYHAPLAKLELLKEREIEIGVPRSGNDITASVSVLARGRIRERIRVKPAVNALVKAGRQRIADQVRTEFSRRATALRI